MKVKVEVQSTELETLIHHIEKLSSLSPEKNEIIIVSTLDKDIDDFDHKQYDMYIFKGGYALRGQSLCKLLNAYIITANALMFLGGNAYEHTIEKSWFRPEFNLKVLTIPSSCYDSDDLEL